MRGGDGMLFEGDLIGQFKLPDDDHRALVITDGNDTYTIIKSKDTDADLIKDTEYWGLLAKGKDGHSPSLNIGSNGNWLIDGVDSGHIARGPAGGIDTISQPGDTDLNALTSNGFYTITSGTMTNGPSNAGSDDYTLLVYGDANARTQILHGTGQNQVWIRGNKVNNWSDWRMITQWN